MAAGAGAAAGIGAAMGGASEAAGSAGIREAPGAAENEAADWHGAADGEAPRRCSENISAVIIFASPASATRGPTSRAAATRCSGNPRGGVTTDSSPSVPDEASATSRASAR